MQVEVYECNPMQLLVFLRCWKCKGLQSNATYSNPVKTRRILLLL